MGKETLVIFLGIWVALQSFLGFPLQWDLVILAILGVAILGLGILLRRDALLRNAPRTHHTETFAENVPSEDSVITEQSTHVLGTDVQA
jgi:hypothetical protein